jgi:hypothetical protein
MVLSFVVFVTFVVFLYTIIEPSFETDRDQQTLLNSLETSLIDMFSDDLTTQITSIDESYSPGTSCISIPVVSGTENMNAIVKDEDNNITDSVKTSSSFKIAFSGQTFFKVLYSNESFVSSGASLGSCASPDESSGEYSVGFTRTKEYIFENKILEAMTAYEEDYDDLKESLNIQNGGEFEFSFVNSSGGIVGTLQKNVSISVYAEEIPIQYINTTADISSGFLNIRVWS